MPRHERLRRLAFSHAAVLPLLYLSGGTGVLPYLPFLVVAGVVALVATGPFQADLAFNGSALPPRVVERWRVGFYAAIFFGLPVYLLYWWAYVRPRD